ncbi:MAG TPA: amidohydrolase family protein [Bacteroidales bacterium]|jgi:predicted TIM-barrel fold metal-dependent hydrolase|nr:amidohydrolase family protein [Bacteroidales bacterium]HNR41792.1 amidohydrolase family protein [Bacteroidales bacterium]HPM19352.1 amidohydrolase family protein [Bacteroidales bacterium]HQG76459.1 amidohydrolase family protein [Bacteroidales bacterium]
MTKNIYLVTRRTNIDKASFPVIDAHNHLWGNWQVEKVVETMDRAGVVSYCDLTGNVRIEFKEGGYRISPGDISDFFDNCAEKYPGRFYCFTMANLAQPADKPLFTDHRRFVEEFIEMLNMHVNKGAKGLKVLKELGLRYRDAGGSLIPCDDQRLFPLWEEAGRLGIPVLIHQADPAGFFEPVTPENEHYDNLKKYHSWSFADPSFPRKTELLKQRDNLVKQHPGTVFILPHFANYAENIQYVSGLLDENPNVYIDFSARIDELGRQPYSSREFFIRYQDRIIFGTDMPANIDDSLEMYRTYFRFLETFDESFYSPDYDGTFGYARWPVCGIGLPREVLKKIYSENILRIIPSLKSEITI